jgi:hypothetical protein
VGKILVRWAYLPHVQRIVFSLGTLLLACGAFACNASTTTPDPLGEVPGLPAAPDQDSGGSVLPDGAVPDADGPHLDGATPHPDGGVQDSGVQDGGNDGNTSDGAAVDSGHDGGPHDSGPVDSGFPDTGFDAGFDAGPSPDCVSLDSCCQLLGSQMYSGCESIVSSNMGASCASVLQSYLSSGYCTGGTSCQDLSACCPQLPATWQSSCTSNVDLNNDGQCKQLFQTYQTDGYCGGGPAGACTALDACCNQLPSGNYSTCEYYVTAGSQTDCDTIHQVYKSDGYCN